MSTIYDQIDALAAKLKQLPADRQNSVVEALREMTDESYALSDDELRVLNPALAEVKRGVGLVDATTDELLNRPWA